MAMQRVVAHIDMDCFYVGVECARDPALRGLPCAVVQYNPNEPHGVSTRTANSDRRIAQEQAPHSLIAVSYEARAAGVTRSMRSDEALRTCPSLVLVQVPTAHGKGDLRIYKEASDQVVEILASRATVCEKLSVDEVAIDITDASRKVLHEADANSNSAADLSERARRLHCHLGGVSAASLAAASHSRAAVRSGAFSRVSGPSGSSSGSASADTLVVDYRSEDDAADDEDPDDGAAQDRAPKDESDDANISACWAQLQASASMHEKLLVAGAIVVAELRQRIERELRFTCSGGVASNKLLAKVAGGLHKPNQQTLLLPRAVMTLLEPMPIGRLWGLGGKLGRRVMDTLCIETVGELRAYSRATLVKKFGAQLASRLWGYARGEIEDPVMDRQKLKTLASSKLFHGTAALKNDTELAKWVHALASELASRLESDRRRHHRTPTQVIVGIKAAHTSNCGSSCERTLTEVDGLGRTVAKINAMWSSRSTKVNFGAQGGCAQDIAHAGMEGVRRWADDERRIRHAESNMRASGATTSRNNFCVEGLSLTLGSFVPTDDGAQITSFFTKGIRTGTQEGCGESTPHSKQLRQVHSHSWSCAACTFLHCQPHQASFLACEVCGAPRAPNTLEHKRHDCERRSKRVKLADKNVQSGGRDIRGWLGSTGDGLPHEVGSGDGAPNAGQHGKLPSFARGRNSTIAAVDSSGDSCGYNDRRSSNFCERTINSSSGLTSNSANANAFSMMMNSARTQARREYWQLQRVEAGGWLWSWNCERPAPVLPDAQWNCSISMKETGSAVDTVLELSTNCTSNCVESTPFIDGGSCGLTLMELQSGLQKAVRRGEVRAAVQCAAEMMRKRDKRGNTGFNMLVRRIPVISIEDAVLHRDLPLVVWLVVATSKGYQPSKLHVHSILRVVAELAASKQREYRPPRIFATTSVVMDDSCDQPPSSASCDAMPATVATLVRALICRGRFGGMKGDVRMLFQFAHAWKSRFSDKKAGHAIMSWVQTWPDGEHVMEAVSSYVREPADDQATLPYLRSLGPMTAKDFLPAALDFHICNIVGDVMSNELVQRAGRALLHASSASHYRCIEEMCRRAMWLFRSSCSVKLYVVFDADGDSRIDRNAESSDIDKEKSSLQALWDTMAGPVERWSMNYIMRRVRH